MKHAPLLRALDWIGVAATDAIVETSLAYAKLLGDEGLRAGVIGPNEPPRLWSRHIADSVCFGSLAVGERWLDVGSGGGLPGIPLAICHPDVEMTLLDRSGRRTDLVRRWVRALDLENVVVVQGDADRYVRTHDTLLFRASLGLDAAVECTRRLATSVGVFGLSHTTTSPNIDLEGVDVVPVPHSVLDSAATILRITP